MILPDLIYNLAILVTISVFSGFIDHRYKRIHIVGQSLQGLLFGLATIVGMMNPFVLTEGIIFDGRSIIISLAAFFFGPVTGIITAVIATAYRLYLGGDGSLMGVFVISTSLLTGLVFYYWRKKQKLKKPAIITLYLLGLIVHIMMLAFIITLPESFQMETFNLVALTILGGYPLVTVLIGKILLDQELNSQLMGELAVKEKRHRTTLYSIGDAVITTSVNGKVESMNPLAEKLTGWTEEMAMDKSIDEVMLLYDENTRSRFENPVQTIITQKSKSVITHSALLIRSDGADIPVDISFAPISNHDERIKGVVIVCRDMSKIRHNQEKLVKSEESYRELFNSISQAVYVQDRDGRFLDVNKGAVNMYGYPHSFFIGKTPEVLSAPGKNDLDALSDHIAKAFSGQQQQFVFWGIKSNGQVFPKEVSVYKAQYFGQEAVIAIAKDIGERLQAEKIIRESEARYRALFNASPVGIILEDDQGTIIDANQTTCELYGYAADELKGKPISVFVPEDQQAQVKDNIKKILEHGYLESQISNITEDGRELQIHLTETTVLLPDGRKGILSIAKDITAEVKAREKLRQNQARTTAIIAAIPDMLFRISKDGVYLDCHVPNSNLLYAPPEQFIGKKMLEILPSELGKKFERLIADTLKSDHLQQLEYTLEIDGQTKWFDARMTSNDPEEVLVIVRDITNRKQSELKLEEQTAFIKTLLDSIPNPLFYMDRQGRYLGVNKAFSAYYGMDQDHIIGKSLFDLDPPEDAATHFESDKRLLEGLENHQHFERQIKLPDGRTRDIIITKSTFLNSTGNIGGLIGMIIDISSRKKMEMELLWAKEKAEESDRLKTAFLNNLSHEIRTPMNAIVGFSALLSDDYDAQQKEQFVKLIHSNAEQLLHIIDDVLVVSRLDAEKMALEKEAVHIPSLFEGLYQTFVTDAQKAGLEMREPLLSPDLPDTIVADGPKIIQVITGFLNNAIKYTPQGHIEFGCDNENNQLRFFVKDTGMGIAKAEQSKVFDRFYRSTAAMKEAIRGNGLGLSIAKGLVEAMNGNIGLISEENQGAVFYFDIPLEAATTDETEKTQSAKTGIDHIRNAVVLIAEDEADNYKLLESMLAGKVKKIIQAKNGEKAVKLAAENKPDIVLMDIKMPIMNGIEATKAILKQRPDIPVIAISAYTQAPETKAALQAGCKSYLSKPISYLKLLEVLSEEKPLTV